MSDDEDDDVVGAVAQSRINSINSSRMDDRKQEQAHHQQHQHQSNGKRKQRDEVVEEEEDDDGGAEEEDRDSSTAPASSSRTAAPATGYSRAILTRPRRTTTAAFSSHHSYRQIADDDATIRSVLHASRKAREAELATKRKGENQEEKAAATASSSSSSSSSLLHVPRPSLTPLTRNDGSSPVPSAASSSPVPSVSFSPIDMTLDADADTPSNSHLILRNSSTASQRTSLIHLPISQRPASDNLISSGGPRKITAPRLDAKLTLSTQASAAASVAASAEIAKLIGDIENSWLQLEFNMMQRPLTPNGKAVMIQVNEDGEQLKSDLHVPRLDSDDNPAATTQSAPTSSTDSAAHSAAFSTSKRIVSLDIDERKELLEHVDLLKERRKADGKIGKSSRVGPRYQCKIPSFMPPPMTPEYRAQIEAEPYDYARFTRDEHPVPPEEFHLQQHLRIAHSGLPQYPINDEQLDRIRSFILRRRERKQKEDERRANQSVQQQVQEARASFNFHTLDSKKHIAGGPRSTSPPLNPLDSYGSVTYQDVSTRDSGDVESKRRSSRITPSLVVKQLRKPAASPTASAAVSKGPANSPEQIAADKKSREEQAKADRKLAEKLQKYFEREPPAKQQRKSKAKDPRPSTPPRAPLTSEHQRIQAELAAAAASNQSIAELFRSHVAAATLHTPPSSLAALTIQPTIPSAAYLTSPSRHRSSEKRKRAISIESDDESLSPSSERKHSITTTKPPKSKLILAPSPLEVARATGRLDPAYSTHASASVSSLTSNTQRHNEFKKRYRKRADRDIAPSSLSPFTTHPMFVDAMLVPVPPLLPLPSLQPMSSLGAPTLVASASSIIKLPRDTSPKVNTTFSHTTALNGTAATPTTEPNSKPPKKKKKKKQHQTAIYKPSTGKQTK